MSPLILKAPLQGWVCSLDEAPDPVFSGRILGDGLAIDPTGSVLHAPCDGVVSHLAPTSHAVSLRTAEGAEVLMHIGLETMALKGEGFTTHVTVGQTVNAGQPLISFDMDLLARRAKSLLTPVIVVNGDAFAIVRRVRDGTTDVGGEFMVLEPLGQGSTRSRDVETPAVTRSVTVSLQHGLHARPAALVAAEARRWAAETAILAHDRRANARSPVAVMALGVGCGDLLTLWARGADAEPAVAALADLIEQGITEAPTPVAAAVGPPAYGGKTDARHIAGAPAAPGLAIGSAVRLVDPEVTVDDVSTGAAAETLALDAALRAVSGRISVRGGRGSGEQQAIMAAHAAFLEDPELTAAARAAIGRGESAGVAWRGAVRAYVSLLQGLPDERMAGRAADLMDLERQVLLELNGEVQWARPLPNNAILLADELLPSQLAALDAGRIAGLCTARGGPTSHVAILAAAMNVPAVVAAGPGVLAIEDGALLILDGDAGLLTVAARPAEIEAAQTRLAERQARRADARLSARSPARMADGTRIEVFANIASPAEAAAAVEAGAEGCGLLRTEFLFLDRQSAPDEAEQTAQYQAIAAGLDGRPLVVRTLDVGGDKPVAYLPIPAEENPALGLRGVRVGLWRPQILTAQLRAILQVEPRGQCRIMIPMVSSVSELTRVRAMLDAVRAEIGMLEPVQLGAMIETPAAAVTADLIAAEADFLSIGTNDLAQYALAMDRGNPALAADVDALHPAVLRLIGEAARGGRARDRSVSVCGGLASDLVAAPILIGLGVGSLSAAPAVIPELKALIRTLTMVACRDLSSRALAQTSAQAVRALPLIAPEASLRKGAVS